MIPSEYLPVSYLGLWIEVTAKEVVTVFLMPNEKYTYLNSSIVKEVARCGGDVSSFVPAFVEAKLKERFG